MAVLHKEYYKGTGNGQKNIQVNQDMRAYIESHPDGDFSHILVEDDRWQVLYHPSDIGASILNWYEWKKDASIPEVGGEFGALAGLLCEHAAHVTAVKYDPFKAEAICRRYEDRHNLDIYAGNILDIEFGEGFDYIVMMGCLERQCGGSKSSKECGEHLKRIVTLPKPNERLLAAVDNRYGLRCFCGEVGTYTGKPFTGVKHYPQTAKGYTFSRQELLNIMKEAGFKSVRFYYPLPDYKLAQMIYSNNYLPQKDLGERLLFYHRDQSTLLIPEQQLYSDLIDNQVFPSFANSFLTKSSLDGESSSILFTTVTTDQGKNHELPTRVHEISRKGEKKEEQIVKKRALYRDDQPSIESIYNNMTELEKRGIPVVPHEVGGDAMIMSFIPDITCSDYLGKLVSVGDRETSGAIFEMLHKNALESSEIVPGGENKLPEAKEILVEYGPTLKQCYVDMVPFNCFYIDGQLFYSDQEFVKESYPAVYPIYRALIYTCALTPDAEQLVPISKVKNRYGLVQLWDIFREEEDRFIADNRRYGVY